MTKRLICSRGTEETILETWHQVDNVINSLPGIIGYDFALYNGQTVWLDSKCEKQYFVKNTMYHEHIYFESESDAHMYLAHAQRLKYPHHVTVGFKNDFEHVLDWCTKNFGLSLNHTYPEGEWYDKKTRNKISNTWDSQFFFKQEDPALQFALTFT